MDQTQRKLSPFLQGALEKDESERSFLERMAVNIYGPILEADEDRNKPAITNFFIIYYLSLR